MKCWLAVGLLGVFYGAHGFAVRFCSELSSDSITVRYHDVYGREKSRQVRASSFIGELDHYDMWGHTIEWYVCNIVHATTGKRVVCEIRPRDALVVLYKDDTLVVYQNTRYDTGNGCVCSDSPCVDDKEALHRMGEDV